MTRFLVILGIGLSLSVAGIALASYPQQAVAANLAGGSGSDLSSPPQPTDAQAAAQAAAAQKTTPPSLAQAQACSGSDISCFFGWVMTEIASLFAWLLGVAMLVLDTAVYYTVVKMGDILGQANGITAIPLIWRIMRDLGNVALLFGFIAIGLETVLGINFYGGGTKLLPTLIIVAVLLNFSLFFASAVVDVSNLFATEFYTQINDGNIPAPPQWNSFSKAVGEEGVSNAIMSQLGLQTLYTDALDYGTTASSNAMNLFTGADMMYIGFLSIFLFMVASFVMFSLAFVLVARFIILIVLLVVSPIGLAAYAIPQLKARGKQWWSMLIAQSITAPVLLLLLYVALRVITDAHFMTSFMPSVSGSSATAAAKQVWSGAISGGNLDGFAGILLSFFVAMGLLLAVVMTSKSMSAWGAGAATKLGGMASFGAISLGMRGTFGAAGLALTNRRMMAAAKVREGDSGLKKIGRRALRPITGIGQLARGSTFDTRNTRIGKAAFGAFGVDAGKGATLTAQRVRELQYGRKPIKEYLDKGEKEYTDAARAVDFENAVEAGNDPVIKKMLAKMSGKEIEELDGIKEGVNELVQNLSPQQFESLMKSDNLKDKEKGAIKEARFRPLSAAVTSGDTDAVKRALNDMSKGELEVVPADLLSSRLVLDSLSEKQRDTLTDSKERTAAEKKMVRDNSAGGKVESAFDAAAAAAGGGAAGRLAGAVAVAVSPDFDALTTPQIVKLRKEILLQPAVASKLTTNTLIKLAEENKFTPGEMRSVGTIIRTTPGADLKTVDYVTVGPGKSLW